MTLEFFATVTFNDFDVPVPEYASFPSGMHTLSIGDPFSVVVSLNTDPRFLTVPDFGADYGSSEWESEYR